DALDAATGAYLFSIDAGTQNVVTAIDPVTGVRLLAERGSVEADPALALQCEHPVVEDPLQAHPAVQSDGVLLRQPGVQTGVCRSLSKPVVNQVHPFVISFLIQLIPAVALLPSLRRLRVARSDWKFFALSGVIGTVAGPITYFYGHERTTASNAVFLSNSESLFTMLFAYAFLGERATRREYVALGG